MLHFNLFELKWMKVICLNSKPFTCHYTAYKLLSQFYSLKVFHITFWTLFLEFPRDGSFLFSTIHLQTRGDCPLAISFTIQAQTDNLFHYSLTDSWSLFIDNLTTPKVACALVISLFTHPHEACSLS